MGQTGERRHVSRNRFCETNPIVDKWITPQPPAQTPFRPKTAMTHRVTPLPPGAIREGPAPARDSHEGPQPGCPIHARHGWGTDISYRGVQPRNAGGAIPGQDSAPRSSPGRGGPPPLEVGNSCYILPAIGHRVAGFAFCSRDRPVISRGMGRFIISSMVGAMSARVPSGRSFRPL